jgi:hypothetical protein
VEVVEEERIVEYNRPQSDCGEALDDGSRGASVAHPGATTRVALPAYTHGVWTAPYSPDIGMPRPGDREGDHLFEAIGPYRRAAGCAGHDRAGCAPPDHG